MVCWRRLDELPAEPLPWLLGVARRVLSTQRRGERRGAALHRRLTESGTPRPAVGALSPVVGSTGAALRDALEQLSETDREILLLIAWEGLSPTQAATAPADVAAYRRLYRERPLRLVGRERQDGHMKATLRSPSARSTRSPSQSWRWSCSSTPAPTCRLSNAQSTSSPGTGARGRWKANCSATGASRAARRAKPC